MLGPQNPSRVLIAGYIVILAIVVLAGMSTSNGRANGSGAGSTGAPCDNSIVCGHPACHGDNAFGNTTQTLELRDLITDQVMTSYVPGKSYEVQIKVFSGAGTGRFGFQATALQSDLSDAGTWYDPGGNVQIATAPDCNNNTRTYAEHSTPHFLSTFIVKWKAPECDIGPVKFYFAGNKVNNNGAPSGDSGGMGDSSTYMPNTVDHLVLDQASLDPGHYWAQHSITVSGLLSNPDSASLIAGDSIEFAPEFEIASGASITVNLHNCPE